MGVRSVSAAWRRSRVRRREAILTRRARPERGRLGRIIEKVTGASSRTCSRTAVRSARTRAQPLDTVGVLLHTYGVAFGKGFGLSDALKEARLGAPRWPRERARRDNGGRVGSRVSAPADTRTFVRGFDASMYRFALQNSDAAPSLAARNPASIISGRTHARSRRPRPRRRNRRTLPETRGGSRAARARRRGARARVSRASLRRRRPLARRRGHAPPR